MSLRDRIKKLEGLAALHDQVRAAGEEVTDEDVAMYAALDAWEAGGRTGPLPPDPPSVWLDKLDDERRGHHHRLYVGLLLQARGRPLPDDFDEKERQEVKDLAALGVKLGPDAPPTFPTTRLNWQAMADIAPYREVIEQFIQDPGPAYSRDSALQPAPELQAMPVDDLAGL